MSIYEVPLKRRYWVVRAEGGKFYENFIIGGIIALGHLDKLDLPENKKSPYQPDFDTIITKLHKNHEELAKEKKETIRPRSTSSQLNQVKAFLYEMQVGDWVLTLGMHSIRFGRIIGHPRLNKKILKVIHNEATGQGTSLKYHLRRNVVWGPELSRSKLPFGLTQSLRANQTVFNIDKHIEAIYHTLYPAFNYNNKLYLSARINTPYAVKNYSISSLFNFLNELEVIAKEFEKGISIDNFEETFDNYLKQNLLTLTTKAQFHSPGEIWNCITSFSGNINTWQTYCIFGYAMIFGNQKLGFDGLVDLETRKKIWEIIISRMGKNNIKEVTHQLGLSAPKNDTKQLEDKSNDETTS